MSCTDSNNALEAAYINAVGESKHNPYVLKGRLKAQNKSDVTIILTNVDDPLAVSEDRTVEMIMINLSWIQFRQKAF